VGARDQPAQPGLRCGAPGGGTAAALGVTTEVVDVRASEVEGEHGSSILKVQGLELQRF
jgi:hypothetical protein